MKKGLNSSEWQRRSERQLIAAQKQVEIWAWTTAILLLGGALYGIATYFF